MDRPWRCSRNERTELTRLGTMRGDTCRASRESYRVCRRPVRVSRPPEIVVAHQLCDRALQADLRPSVDLSEFGAPQELGIHGDDDSTQ